MDKSIQHYTDVRKVGRMSDGSDSREETVDVWVVTVSLPNGRKYRRSYYAVPSPTDAKIQADLDAGLYEDITTEVDLLKAENADLKARLGDVEIILADLIFG